MSPTKADLRIIALKRRDGVSAEARARFAAHLGTVGLSTIREIAPVAAPIVALYSPIGSEPDVGPLAAALHRAGFILALPVDWSSGTALVYRHWMPGDALAAGPLGIGEPLIDAEELEPDVILTPMAAFDRYGQRIGYGVGNVDRTLAKLRIRKAIAVLGIAYAFQEEPLLPNEAHDQPLDFVLTENTLFRCRN